MNYISIMCHYVETDFAVGSTEVNALIVKNANHLQG
jgi:hypothetical protein